MAESLAIATAVVQFVDVAVRLSCKLSWLCSELRDVPQWLHTLKSELDQQIAVGQLCQHTYATTLDLPALGVNSANGNTAPSWGPLEDYLRTMEQLSALIEKVSHDSATGKIERSWKSLKAVYHRRDITILCETLVQKKGTLSLWLTSINANMYSEIKEAVKQIAPGVAKAVDQTTGQQVQLDRMSQQIDNIHNLMRNNTSRETEVLGIVSETSLTVGALIREYQKVSLTKCHKNHSTSASEHTESGSSTSSSNGVNRLSLADASDTSMALRWQPCTCRTINQITQVEPIRNIRLRKSVRRHHQPYCQRSTNQEQRLEFLISIVLPSWLLCYILNLGIVVNWGSNIGWTISPIVLGARRVVDPALSPGFRAIQHIKDTYLSDDPLQEAEAFSHMRALAGTLRDLLRSGAASALDEDSSGNTLLFEVINIFIKLPMLDRHMSLDFAALVRYLLESGANPNTIWTNPWRNLDSISYCWAEQQEQPLRYDNRSGTALDQFAWELVRSCGEGYEQDVGNTIYMDLVHSDGYFSRPPEIDLEIHPYFWFGMFAIEHRQLETFPEQFEVSGLGEVARAVFRRSEIELERAMQRGDLDHASPTGLTAMHLAIFWPQALRRLIDAGANINCEDRHGRRPVHVAVSCGQGEAVSMLLKADCAIWTLGYSGSLLQESLSKGRSFDHITELVIDALIDRHTRLMNLALSILPQNLALMKRFVGNELREDLAPLVYQELSTRGHVIPVALEPDRDGNGVYDTADSSSNIRLTAPLAERLWRGGFRRIDDYGPTGLTPILQSWYIANFDMITWFLGKGVSLFGMHRETQISGLHLFAARVAYTGAWHGYNRASTVNFNAQHYKQLMQDKKFTQDSCSCMCSNGGCTPLSTLIKGAAKYDIRLEYEELLPFLGIWQDKLIYTPEEEPDHIEKLWRSILFHRLGLLHTCCFIDIEGNVEVCGEWQHHDRGSRQSQLSEGILSNPQQGLDKEIVECRKRMTNCGCPALEKPLCALFRGSCDRMEGIES